VGEFTRLGCGLWEWEPFISLDEIARTLWLALYTTAEAKRVCPGLWHGGIGTMADAAKMPSDSVLASLDKMLERRLVEFDPKHRVLRLTQLPDAGEKPYNGAAVRGWWNRFVTLPACAVRDAHIPTLWWILETAGFSSDHEKAWKETFGRHARVVVRNQDPSGPNGVRRLLDSDTGTTKQPSLFGPKQVPIGSEAGSSSSISNQRSGSTTRSSTIPDLDLGIGIGDPEGESVRGGRPVLTLVPPLADVPSMAEQTELANHDAIAREVAAIEDPVLRAVVARAREIWIDNDK